MLNFEGFKSHLGIRGYSSISLLPESTPIHYLPRLSKRLGTDIYMKRDDAASIGLGGNKLRKLEYLMAAAKANRATRIITIGALQSNHARLTACVAKMLGFDVDLVLKESVPDSSAAYRENGNLVLDRLVGAKIHRRSAQEDVLSYAKQLAKTYSDAGEQVYLIPVGGSNLVGSLGYMHAAYELQQQSAKLDIQIHQIALASGSGGTHAGLLAGVTLLNWPAQVRAYNVQPEKEPLLTHTVKLLSQISEIFDPLVAIDPSSIRLIQGHHGDAYGIPSIDGLDAIALLAQTEGIFLDPVYTGKAFAGLIADIESGKLGRNEPILFIHTGGVPGLFAYPGHF